MIISKMNKEKTQMNSWKMKMSIWEKLEK